jgi:hypothetical protein
MQTEHMALPIFDCDDCVKWCAGPDPIFTCPAHPPVGGRCEAMAMAYEVAALRAANVWIHLHDFKASHLQGKGG